jgi:hypothetical protein
MRPSLHDIARWPFLLMCTVAAACGSGSDPHGSGGTGPAPVISISVAPTTIRVVQGTMITVTITVQRTAGFAGSVTVALEGLPAEVPASTPSQVTSGSVTTVSMPIAATATAPLGLYTITVRAKGSGVSDATTSLALTVGSGVITVNLAGCVFPPTWAAFQDGTGPWQQAGGSNGVFQLTADSSFVGFAYSDTFGSSHPSLVVRWMTRSELVSPATSLCAKVAVQPSQLTKSLKLAVTGLGSTGWALLHVAGLGGSIIFDNQVSAIAVDDAPHDVITWWHPNVDSTTLLDRVLVRRGVNVPDGTTLSVDRGDADAFPWTFGTLDVNGHAAGAPLSAAMGYLVSPGCVSLVGGSLVRAGSTAFTAFGFPPARQLAGDFHTIAVTDSGPAWILSATESFHAMASRTVALPPTPEAPVVTTVPGSPYERIRADVSVPPEYALVTVYYLGTGPSHLLSATRGWLQGSSASLMTPDFTGVSGWHNEFGVPSGRVSHWTVSLDTPASNACVEGARSISAVATQFR